jgi:hypothetical protein
MSLITKLSTEVIQKLSALSLLSSLTLSPFSNAAPANRVRSRTRNFVRWSTFAGVAFLFQSAAFADPTCDPGQQQYQTCTPTGISATLASLQSPAVQLSWQLYSSPPPQKVLVLRQPQFPSSTPGFSTSLQGVEVNGDWSGVVDKTSQWGTFYTYEVCAEYQTLFCSGWVAFTVPSSGYGASFTAPTVTNVAVADGTIQVSWTSKQSYGNYIVHYSDMADVMSGIPYPQQDVNSQGNGGTFTISNVQPGHTYLFGVDGCDSDLFKSLCSGWSADTSVYVPFGIPTNVQADDESFWTNERTWTPRLHVQWQPGPNSGPLRVVLVAHSGGQYSSQDLDPHATDYTFDAPQIRPGTSYYVVLCSGPLCTGSVATIKASLPKPHAPGDVRARWTPTGEVSIFWESGDNITASYDVERLDSVLTKAAFPGPAIWRGQWVVLKPPAGSYSIDDHLPPPLTDRKSENQYRVCSQNDSGRTCSQAVSVTPIPSRTFNSFGNH